MARHFLSSSVYVQNLSLTDKNNTPVGMHKPLVSSSAATMLSTSSEPPTQSGINKINQLMSMVDWLAQEVPTTGERLSRISGLFPPGHGPCVKAVEEASNYDVDELNNLKMAIINVRDIFVNFGDRQDEICVEFEKEAVLIERQMNKQDDVAVEEVKGVRYSRAANHMVIICSSLCLKSISKIICNISWVPNATPLASYISMYYRIYLWRTYLRSD